MTTAVPIECFMVERNGIVARWLRRFTHSSGAGFECADGYHYAWKRVADAPMLLDDEGHIINGSVERGDFDPSEWLPTCERCGTFWFAGGDLSDYTYQLFVEPFYVRADGGPGGPWVSRWRTPREIEGLPPGAMFYADWNDFWVGPDGRCLVVILPTDVPEPWMVDGPATGGGHWSRTGTPPLVTASPSIHAVDRGYHGHLQSGFLTAG